MGFYKKDENQILAGENFVYSPIVTLKAEDKDTYEYPQDGWYWFDTFDEALKFFAEVKVDTYTLTPRQIRLVLSKYKIREQVEQLIAKSNNYDLKDWWEYSLEYKRDNELLILMAAELGLTSEDIDNMFIEGAAL